MANCEEPDALEIARTVAVARLLLGGEMNIQVPPNLNPNDHRLLLRAGINDWGGISPVTRITSIQRRRGRISTRWPETCREEGFDLAGATGDLRRIRRRAGISCPRWAAAYGSANSQLRLTKTAR